MIVTGEEGLASAAKAAGFAPVKVNAVAIKGATEDDVVPLAAFARAHGLELRFIEYMPLDAQNAWERDKVLLAAEILDRLAAAFGPLHPAPDQDPRAPAVDYEYADGGGRVTVTLGEPAGHPTTRLPMRPAPLP